MSMSTSFPLYQIDSSKNQIPSRKQSRPNLFCQKEHLDFIPSGVIEEIKFMAPSVRANVIG